MADQSITKELMLRQIGKAKVEVIHFRNQFSKLSMTQYQRGGNTAKDRVKSMDLESYGRYLLIGTSEGLLLMFDTVNFDRDSGRRLICSLPRFLGTSRTNSNSIETVKWFPNDPGMFVTGGQDSKIKVWETNTLQPVETFNFHTCIHQASISPVGGVSHGLVAVTSLKNNVKVIDLKSGQYSHELRGLVAVSCAWSPTTDYLIAAGGLESTVRLWDIRSSKKCMGDIKVTDHSLSKTSSVVNGTIFTPNGTRLLTSCDSLISCWDVEYYKNMNVEYEPIVNRIRRPLNFKAAACGSYEVCFVPSDSNIVILNVKTGETIVRLPGHYGFCNCLDYNVKSMELYSGGDDDNIVLWSPILESPDLEKLNDF